MVPSLTVDMNSATPYTDATQVCVICILYLDVKCEYIIQLIYFTTVMFIFFVYILKILVSNAIASIKCSSLGCF